MLRGKAIAALLAIAAVLAGAQALVPSAASAEKVDCTFEPDQTACNEDSSPGGESGNADNGSASSESPSPGTSGQGNVANYTWEWNPKLVTEPEPIDDPTQPDPAVDRALKGTQPVLQSMDPAYIEQLTREHRLDRKVVWAADLPPYIFVLSGDCNRLSTIIGNLAQSADSLSDMIDSGVTSGAGVAPFRKSLRSVRAQKRGRMAEYRLLECASVISLEGRD